MFLDANEVGADSALNYDICIVGAGVAGLTLASELEKSGLRIALIESGSLKPDRETQALYKGENIGTAYYPLDTARSRQFGGSANRWLMELEDGTIGARLFPLDSLDFEKRDWVPHSGWPFDLDHLRPYYERAADFLELSPRGFSEEAWSNSGSGSGFPFQDGDVFTKVYQCARRNVYLDRLRDQLKKSENVTVYLNANVLEIETDATGGHVAALRVSTLREKSLSFSSKITVVAAGAIEAARLLLLSNSQCENGLGNEHDLVGRFFMEHPHFWQGTLVPEQNSLMRHKRFYATHISNDGFPIIGQISIDTELQRSQKLLNHAIVFKASPKQKKPLKGYPVSGGIAAIKGAIKSASRGELDSAARLLSTIVPVAGDLSVRFFRKAMRLSRKVVDLRQERVFQLNHMTEQAPNPNSRVRLGKETDRFGQHRVELDWQLSELDADSIFRSTEFIDTKFQQAGIGKIIHELNSKELPPDLHGGWHHMGTTRMHDNAKSGVTDSSGRVHGLSNLYIAGPSLFPTSGSANPVFTIVALSIRLADALKRKTAASEV